MEKLLKRFTQYIGTVRRPPVEGQVRDSPANHPKTLVVLLSLCLCLHKCRYSIILILSYSHFMIIFSYISTLSNLKSKDCLRLGYDAVPLGNRVPALQRNVQVKQSLYRPEQALRAPGVSGFQISRRQTHEGVRLSALLTGRLYPLPPPPRKYFWYLFLLEAEFEDIYCLQDLTVQRSFGKAGSNYPMPRWHIAEAVWFRTSLVLDHTDVKTLRFAKLKFD